MAWTSPTGNDVVPFLLRINVLGVVVLLAQTTGGDVPDWAKWGILGIAVAALASGKFLTPSYIANREREGRLAAEERERQLLTADAIATREALHENTRVLQTLIDRIDRLADSR